MTMDSHKNIENPTLEEILKTDAWARERALKISKNLKRNN